VDLKAWDERQTVFLEKQALKNEAVEKQRSAYLSGAADAVIEYCDMVLSASAYPDYFPQEFSLDYNPETKIVVVDYSLPPPGDLPKVREVKFVSSRQEFVEQCISQSQSDKLYDDLLYQITLRTVHELFEADTIGAIASVAFNGIVTSIDRSTGKQVTACVLSLQVLRDELMAISLANVEPKSCFRALKGVGSSKLHSLAAVAPIMQVRRDDGRFVSAYEVATTLDESSNLAAMDWEDFEHLIREVFEKEFSSTGGEVKVTQASRDGGVDAVAFDPDPIRGGKIVIQAKRYTNTVSVGAVRDLYGTVMNEGANKGILVTTSDYGPDAYDFAKGKPLILLNGANLLHMLEKHGHRARIDLQEARRIAMNLST
jgi:restriction system protein